MTNKEISDKPFINHVDKVVNTILQQLLNHIRKNPQLKVDESGSFGSIINLLIQCMATFVHTTVKPEHIGELLENIHKTTKMNIEWRQKQQKEQPNL